MQIRDLVAILENNGLIVPDYYGRKWSEEYDGKSTFWNPRLKGIQTLNDDGQRSSGFTERLIYDLEVKKYALTHIQTLIWNSTLCHTSYKQEDKLCLTYLPKRESLILEKEIVNTSMEDIWKSKLGIKGPIKIEESGEFVSISYSKNNKIVRRGFQFIEESN